MITTYTDFRQQLKSWLDKVRKDHTPLFVTSANGEDVFVLQSLIMKVWKKLSIYLKNPVNAERLLKGIENYKKGLGQERSLIEE